MQKKPIKGLFSDAFPLDQPEGFAFHGKNGIMNTNGSLTNEPGFSLSSAQIPYHINGVIETDDKPIIFSTDDVNSSIGFYDPVNDTYQVILNDTIANFPLGFKRANFIIGEYQKNSLNEYIIAFTDKVIEPRVLNCNNPRINKPGDLLLFLRATAPNPELRVETGGELSVGSYVISLKYGKVDGSETANIYTSSPVIITSSSSNIISDKAIRLILTEVDTTYDVVIISILKRVAGVSSAIQLDPITISPEMQILYTGNNTNIVISVEEFLAVPQVYNKAKAITQLNDVLYIGNLEQSPSFNYQSYANEISVKIKSELVDLSSVPIEIASGQKKSFMHEDVVALYIRLKFTDGSKTKAFHIPGRVALPGETSQVSLDGGALTGKRFQLFDTCIYPNPQNKTVTPGLWENENELYTDANFGQLVGQKVRHHRMPSLRWCKENFYPGDSSYGRTSIDLLGIEVSNVIIPEELSDKFDGFEILFAKRTVGNSLVLGQSLAILGAQDSRIMSSMTGIKSTSGNWSSIAERYYKYPNVDDKFLNPVRKFVRLHPFDVLFNNLSLPTTDCYISSQYKLRANNLSETTATIGVDLNFPAGERSLKNSLPVTRYIDYMNLNRTIAPMAVSENDRLRKSENTILLPNNISLGTWDNSHLESAVGLKLVNDFPNIITSTQVVPMGANSEGGPAASSPNINALAQFEETVLINLMVKRSDVYNSLTSQSLVATGKVFKSTYSGPIFAGDTFIGPYQFHTYGLTGVDDLTPDNSANNGGVKILRRVVVESVSNLNARREGETVYQKYWPSSPMVFNDINSYIVRMNRDIDPNQFVYSRELNSLNDFEDVKVYNSLTPQIVNFPYRIAIGGKFKREGFSRSWRSFRALDYYECVKNSGPIEVLSTWEEQLLIHHKNSLFVTQDRSKLETDTISVTLGTGDIFQFEPKEALDSKHGYGGIQSSLGCLKTPIGYVFVDAQQGQVFVYNGKLELLNAGLDKFLISQLNVDGSNTFTGNGVTIGYDPVYKRILLTVKNDLEKTPDYKGEFVNSPSYVQDLKVGKSLVKIGGKLMLLTDKEPL